jgi:flagellar hook-basal body complex protein FliE
MAIQPVGVAPGQAGAKPERASGTGFVQDLTRMIQEANQSQVDAAHTAEQLMVNGEGSIHDAMLAMSKADGSFRLLMEMRNRLVDAVQRLLQAQA